MALKGNKFVTMKGYADALEHMGRTLPERLRDEILISQITATAQYVGPRTPVDTMKLRSAWTAQATARIPPAGDRTVKPVTREAIKQDLGSLRGKKPRYVNWARNKGNRSYATPVLINGHSSKLPAGSLFQGLSQHLRQNEQAITDEAVEIATREE